VDTFTGNPNVTSLSYSPTGDTLAAASTRGVQLWDLATRHIRATLPARERAAVAFSPDGRTLAITTPHTTGLWHVDLPDPAQAIRSICTTIDTALTPQEHTRYLPDQSPKTGCHPTA
jgi:WD40 repeat protein